MARGRDKNYVSIWFWLLVMLVMAIPLLNIVMTLIWAFTGENETRKNYFKVMIVVFCLAIGAVVFMMAVGGLPAVLADKWRQQSTQGATPARHRTP